MKNLLNRVSRFCFETIGLSTPRGRFSFFILISACIFFLPPKWPVSFSVWRHLGVHAPSIGLTRAYRYLLHGRLREAWRQNKLIYVVVAVGGILLAKDAVSLTRARTNTVGHVQHSPKQKTKNLTIWP